MPMMLGVAAWIRLKTPAITSSATVLSQPRRCSLIASKRATARADPGDGASPSDAGLRAGVGARTCWRALSVAAIPEEGGSECTIGCALDRGDISHSARLA